MNRAERRRVDKEHARKIDDGIDLDDLSQEMIGSLIRRTYSAVEQARRSGSVAPILEFMNPLIDKSTQKTLRDSRRWRPCHFGERKRAPGWQEAWRT